MSPVSTIVDVSVGAYTVANALYAGDVKAAGKAAIEVGFNVVAKKIKAPMKAVRAVTKRDIPSIKEQALELKGLNNKKNSVRIQTLNKKLHYDLDGASHKGVETPHVQISYPNTNPKTGQTFWNKDRSADGVKPMTQQDFRIVRKYLKKRS